MLQSLNVRLSLNSSLRSAWRREKAPFSHPSFVALICNSFTLRVLAWKYCQWFCQAVPRSTALLQFAHLSPPQCCKAWQHQLKNIRNHHPLPSPSTHFIIFSLVLLLLLFFFYLYHLFTYTVLLCMCAFTHCSTHLFHAPDARASEIDKDWLYQRC